MFRRMKEWKILKRKNKKKQKKKKLRRVRKTLNGQRVILNS